MLWHELGVLAQAVAGAIDLDDHGVVEQAVQEHGGHYGVAEHLAPFGEAAVRAFPPCTDSGVLIRGCR